MKEKENSVLLSSLSEWERQEKIRQTLEAPFLNRLKKGEVLTPTKLRALARKKGVEANIQDVETFRQGFLHLQQHREIRRPRGSSFQAALNTRYATIFLDLAFFGKPRLNGGNKGFLLGVESLTHQLGAVLFKKRDLDSLSEALKKLLDESVFSRVKLIISDREASLVSDKTVTWLQRKRGIAIHFLPSRSKSYLAERYEWAGED